MQGPTLQQMDWDRSNLLRQARKLQNYQPLDQRFQIGHPQYQSSDALYKCITRKNPYGIFYIKYFQGL